MRRTTLWIGVLTAFVAVATVRAQDDDDGDGPAEGFRGRMKAPEIPATADGYDARQRDAFEARFRGDVDTAIARYKEILGTHPTDVGTHMGMGTAYWEKGELDKAEEWFRKTMALNANQVKAHQFLGQLLMHSGRFADAIEIFNKLHGLDYKVADVTASGHLNLGKIYLIKRKWNDAERHFKATGMSPEPGDRKTAEKGLLFITRLRKTAFWAKENTPLLDVYFSPKVVGAADAEWRKAFVAKRSDALRKMYDKLGWKIPEPIPMYVYQNDDDCYEIADQETAHSFRYSWWLVHTRADATPGHDLAHQVFSRRFGSRPASVPLVEGICTYFDGSGADRHEGARKLHRAGKLRDLVDLHANQKFGEGMMEASASFVAFVVDTYGLDKFLESYRRYNNVMLDPQWKAGGGFKWASALDKIFMSGVGESLATLESKWRSSL